MNKRAQFSILGVIVLVGFLLRVAFITVPDDLMFDEIYNRKQALLYLESHSKPGSHPPVARLLIAQSIRFFGDRPAGWRAANLAAGTIFIVVVWAVTVALFGSVPAGLLAAAFVALDGLPIVYSRTGLPDMFLVLFVQLALLAWLKLRGEQRPVVAGVAAGLAVATKWVGVAVVPLLVIAGMVDRKKITGRTIGILLTSAVAVYLVSFSFENAWRGQFVRNFLDWHAATFRYHAIEAATQRYTTPFYQWPLLHRPILFWIDISSSAKRAVVVSGNPLLWFAAFTAAIGSVIALLKEYRAYRMLLIPTLGYFGFWLSFIMIPRSTYIYHYFNALVFGFILAAFWLSTLLRTATGRRGLALFFLIAIAFTMYLYPIWAGLPLSQRSYEQHRVIADPIVLLKRK